MSDLKYQRLVEGSEMIIPSSDIRSKELLPLVAAFSRNIVRVNTLAQMPVMLTFFNVRDTMWIINAVNKLHQKNEVSLDDLLKAEFTPEMEGEMNRQLEAFQRIPIEEQRALAYEFGLRGMTQDLATSPGVQMSVEAILATVILGTWTAFECLASDLWTSAVDHGPKQLVVNVLQSKKLHKADPISPEMIIELDYDPRVSMGSFLKETQRISFQKLSDIRLFFQVLFGDKKITDLFDQTQEGYIYALAAVRNLLTHNAGKVDKFFKLQTQRFPEFRDLPMNTDLELDGEIVSKLRYSALELGSALVRLVDDIVSPQDVK